MDTALQDFVQEYKPKIDAEIARELERRLADVRAISPHLVPVIEAMQELSVGGKRMRAMLVLLGYQLSIRPTSNSKQQEHEIIKAAVAMELFHLGLLIQDDWMDSDATRRGVAAIHTRYSDPHIGNAVAMLAGDYTFGWGIEMLSAIQLSPERVNAGMQVWGRYFTRVGYGQTLDGLDIANDATIMQILSIKSGEYSCVLPLLLGATLGEAQPQFLDRLEKYGMTIGWVFQLRDDWLGMWGEQKKTGKPAGEQEVKGKKTYATMYGKQKTEELIKKYMDEGMRLAEDNEVMKELVQWLGTRES